MGQINGICEAKEERMKKYLKKVLQLMRKFKEIDFVQIPREENMEADALVKEVLTNEAIDEFNEVYCILSIDFQKVLQVQNEGNWMTPIIFYLKDERLSEGKDEARKLRIQSTRCVLLDEANYVLREVHEGACGNHLGARSLIHKVVCAGYY